jgi:hypothetical protein
LQQDCGGDGNFTIDLFADVFSAAGAGITPIADTDVSSSGNNDFLESPEYLSFNCKNDSIGSRTTKLPAYASLIPVDVVVMIAIVAKIKFFFFNFFHRIPFLLSINNYGVF